MAQMETRYSFGCAVNNSPRRPLIDLEVVSVWRGLVGGGVLAAVLVLLGMGAGPPLRREFDLKRAGGRLFALGVSLIVIGMAIHLTTLFVVLDAGEESNRVGLWSMAFGDLLSVIQMMGATMATFGVLAWLARDADR